MSATVTYVYCIATESGAAMRDVKDAPAGIEGTRVHTVGADDLAALVSALDAVDYDGDATSERIGDPEWLAPRAVAHDAVVTWASDRDAVVPLPMWVMFADDASVAAMLVARADVLGRSLGSVRGAREYGVRVAADATALASAASALDATLAALEQRMAVASPGQAYLMRRKLEAARKASVRDSAGHIAQDIHATLGGSARSSALRGGAPQTNFILDAAYLVEHDRYDDFREALTELIERYGAMGCRFEFTGPWPPYHFVRGNE